ncbi:MAG: NAD(P)H-dependent oxidoreductase subunit E, partial [Pseudomonadota bacterium]
GKGRSQPKGRQLEIEALDEVRLLLDKRSRRRDLLIEFLHLIQDYYGHLSARHLNALSEELGLAQSEVYEVATFYAHFDVVKEGETPPPALTIRVCDSLSCELEGAQKLLSGLKEGLDRQKIRVLRAPCMGRCDQAPVLEIGHRHITHANIEKTKSAIEKQDFKPDIPNYQDFDAYQEKGGYEYFKGLRKGGQTVEEIQDILLSAGLRGLGGAGFPTGRKWSFVRAEKGPRYLAVNGDEGEPGTFKDRYYLEREPHLFLEGMLIAAWAIEAKSCFIYMRDEYPAILEILAREIKALEKAKLINKNYIDLRRGAGAYICGEESAMIESIEGKRGLPRHRPPFVAQVGIFGRPTLVNNVETLYWVARILREGKALFSDVEKNQRKGLRSFSISGRVKKPGVYVLPAGSTILDLIESAGGMLDGHIFKAYQPGGPSAGILPASLDQVAMDFDVLQSYGSFIGSAGVVILSNHDQARDCALNMLKFFEDESCGQCTPCRVGCEKAVKLMQKPKWDQTLLHELCDAMGDASICGLGQAAPNAIRHVMKYFNEEIK